MPVANVGRIMRRVLPPQARISNEAKKAVQQCATEFIKFVAEEAADHEQCNTRRKSINAHDLLLAFHHLDFHNYAATLHLLLQRLNQTKQEEEEKEEASTPNSTTTSSQSGDDVGDDDDDDDEEIHAVPQEESKGANQVQIQSQGQERPSAVALDPITFTDFATGVQYVFAFPN